MDVYGVGLFQTCSFSNCRQNQYGGETGVSNNGTLILSNRFYNAGPLAIVGVFLQMIIGVLCFLTAFVFLPPKPSLTCYLVPVLIFIAFLFQFFTLTEGSNGIYLNGRSARVFDATVVLLVVQMFLSLLAADRIHHLTKVQYVWNELILFLGKKKKKKKKNYLSNWDWKSNGWWCSSKWASISMIRLFLFSDCWLLT